VIREDGLFDDFDGDWFAGIAMASELHFARGAGAEGAIKNVVPDHHSHRLG
jgi:hypothetical protein